MPGEREAGIAALQRGAAAEAVPYLERASADAPEDLPLLLALGSAYGQTGRHPDAVRVVMQAVTMQPSSAQVRYSLAAAYANAGHTEYAVTAAQQALQLQPDYPQARDMIARLTGAPQAAAHAAPAPFNPQATMAMPVQPTSPYNAAPAAQGYGQPQPQYGQQPGYGQQPPAQPGLPTQGPAPYGTPGGAPVGGQAPYQARGAAHYGGSPVAMPYVPPRAAAPPDIFDMKQAVSDWVRVIREPHAFFREQAERHGYNAPLAFLLTFGLVVGASGVIASLIRMVLEPGNAAYALGGMIGGVIGGVLAPLVGAYVWGAVLHVIGRLFGNRSPYNRTFRVAAYGRAPLLLFLVLTTLLSAFLLPNSAMVPRQSGSGAPFGQLTPVQYGRYPSPPSFPGRTTYGGPSGIGRPGYGGAYSANPFGTPQFQALIRTYTIIGPIMFIGFIWVWCLQAIGLRYAQEIPPSSAAGTVFLSILLPGLLFIVACFLLGIVIGIAMAGARGGAGALSPIPGIASHLVAWHGG